MKVRYTERAVLDLTEVLHFLESRNPAAAKRVLSSVRDTVRTLGKHPRSGRAQAVQGVRKAVVLPHGHVIHYGVGQAENTVSILSIQSPAQDRPYDER